MFNKNEPKLIMRMEYFSVGFSFYSIELEYRILYVLNFLGGGNWDMHYEQELWEMWMKRTTSMLSIFINILI